MRIMSSLISLAVLGVVTTAQEQIYRPGNGVTTPVPIERPKPDYTADALASRVEGVITLECVVREDGTVSDGRIVKPLFPSLDAEALQRLADWRFKPGMKDGKPVPVRVQVEMSFSLADSPETTRGPRVDSPEAFKPSKDVTTPRIISEVKPQYTADAMREGVQGSIRMACVVLPDGTVGDVAVKEGLHSQLDREAVRTVRKWRFVPGMKDGSPVPVQVEVEMTFTLGRKPRG